jgi:HK97 family phage portal protein
MIEELMAGTTSETYGPDHDFWYTDIGHATHAGVNVTPETAMRFSTVFACIQKISKTLATLPVHVYEKRGPRETHPVDHELNEVLDWQGNIRATGTTVRSSMYTNRLAWGNGVCEVQWTVDGRVGGLVPLMSKDLRPKFMDNGELRWEHWPEGRYDTTLPPEKYLHDPGPFVLDGALGITPIQSRETIAGAMAAETYANTFFGNGAHPGGFLEFPADINLTDERQDALVEKFNESWQGAAKAHKVGRLREGVKFNQAVGMPHDDMQLLELRKFNRIEICSIFDTPPVMIQELDPGKYTAIEQAMIAWVRDCLLPQCKATESAYKRQFFPDSPLYVRHNLAGLARGDMEARSKFYAAGIQWGWFTRNDVRQWEELNPVEGGDDLWVPMNTMPLGTQGQMVPGSQPPPDDKDDDEGAKAQPSVIVVQSSVDVAGAFLPLLEDVAARVTTKERKAVSDARRRHKGDATAYSEWCVYWFGKHTATVRKAIEPVVCGIEQARGKTASDRPADFAGRYAEHQLEAARAIPTGGAELDGGHLLAELQKTYLEEIPCLTN